MIDDVVQDVLVVAGTCRPGSTTGKVAAKVARVLSAGGLRVRVVEVGDLGLPLCDGGAAQADVDQVRAWRELAARHGCHVWVSPEWHGSMAGSLKNALDHLRVDDLTGHVVGLVAQAGGGVDAISTLDHMRSVARAFRCWVVPTHVSLRGAELDDPTSGDSTRIVRFAGELGEASALLRHSAMTAHDQAAVVA